MTNKSQDKTNRQKVIIDEILHESDRGCILVGASALEELLEELLKSAFSFNEHVIKNAIQPLFETMGALSSFSAKTKLAYSLGLIDKWCFSDLEKIRKIRNVAAHEYFPKSFESPEIIKITQSFEGIDHVVKSMNDKHFDSSCKQKQKHNRMSVERARFILTVSHIVGTLEGSHKKWRHAL
jgi:mannitol operon repressor